MLDIEIEWNKDSSVMELRTIVQTELQKYGEPLRWFISDIAFSSTKNSSKVKVEAVMISTT